MSERRGTKALEVWCKRVTEGYPGVKVENMTTSWRDGLAFCAMIHHFRPDLIDFNSLDKRDVYRNNELAFTIAERHLGIPALLDAEDMVEYEVPDRLSMLTYLSQFYQTFVGQQGNSPNSRTPVKRSSVSPSLSSSPDLSPSMSPTSSSPPAKVQARGASAGSIRRSSRDPCTHCGLPVFLAERLIVGTKRALYHRRCFRCARCSGQLTLANCYETEEGLFCCETCPDEENDKSDTSNVGTDIVEDSSSKRESPCSFDERKSAISNASQSDDEKSSGSRTVDVASQQTGCTPVPLAPTQSATYDLDGESSDSPFFFVHSSSSENKKVLFDICAPLSQNDKLSLSQATKESTISSKDQSEGMQSTSNDIMSVSRTDGGVNRHSESSSNSKYQHLTASTKDTEISCAENTPSSIVKMRKMLFEAESFSSSAENKNSQRRSSQALENSVKPEMLSSRKSKLEELQVCEIPKLDHTEEAERSEEKYSNSTCLGKERGRLDRDEESQQIVAAQEESYSVAKNSNSADVHGNLGKEEEKEERSQLAEPNTYVEGREKRFENFSARNNDSVRPTVNPRRVFLTKSAVEPETSSVSVHKGSKDYPSELNPFAEDDEKSEGNTDVNQKTGSSERKYLNPFEEPDDDDEVEPVAPKQRPPRPPPPQGSSPLFVERSLSGSPRTDLSYNLVSGRLSTSPITLRRQTASGAVTLNPFLSDEEEPAEPDSAIPVPRPRTIRLTPEPSPRPSKSATFGPKIMSSSGHYGSTSSLTSMTSNTSSHRRGKKPAPAPPSHSMGGGLHLSSESKNESLPSSPYDSLKRSPHRRKSRPAPQPPSESKPLILAEESWDGQKTRKDEANRSMQANDTDDVLPRDKSTYGQWKRKKGPAPPRPVPHRRQVHSMPLKELKRELDDIEVKQQELERQGVKLEQTIRLKFEEAPGLIESSMTPDIEVLVLQLFELVNEKNDLFRKQAELMYLRRQQRLEEEHAELEFQIRCLMEQPERNKTDIDKAKEEELIRRLVEVVERRNEIIQSLDMDRIREAEEDNSIHSRLELFTSQGRSDSKDLATPKKVKKDKKKKKDKEPKKKKGIKLDADKDIDEIEAAADAAIAKEKKSKRKWF